jgi:hypothetical protein
LAQIVRNERGLKGQRPGSKEIVEKKNTLQIKKEKKSPYLIKIDTNHPWEKGIQNCTNKGSDPLLMEYNDKMQRLIRGEGVFSSRTTWPEKLLFTGKLPDIVQL